LPTLSEIRDMETLEPELDLEPAPPAIDVFVEGDAEEDPADTDTAAESDDGLAPDPEADNPANEDSTEDGDFDEHTPK